MLTFTKYEISRTLYAFVFSIPRAFSVLSFQSFILSYVSHDPLRQYKKKKKDK